METKAGKECSRNECKRRGQVLSFEEFSKNRAFSDGYEYFCKQCKADLAAARRDRIAKEKASAGNGRRKGQPRDPGPVRSPSLARKEPVIDERIYLPADVIVQIQKAGERKVWEEIAQIAKERLA